MNIDIRICIGLPRNLKYKRLKRAIGESPMEYLICMWGYIAQYQPLGMLVGWTGEEIEDIACWCGEPDLFFNALLSVGFLDEIDNGYYPHDWNEHQSWVIGAPIRSDIARNASNARWNKKNKSGNTASYPKNDQQQCSEDAHSIAVRNAPSPSPSPSPKPKGEDDDETRMADFSHEVENKPSRLTVTDIRFIHSEHFGLQFPPGANNLAVEICERFSTEAIKGAFEAAAVHNKPSMAYVLGVLNGNGRPKSALREDQKPRGRPVTFGESTSIANQEASQRVLRRLLDGQKNAGDPETCGIDFQISGGNGNGNVGGEADCVFGGVG